MTLETLGAAVGRGLTVVSVVGIHLWLAGGGVALATGSEAEQVPGPLQEVLIPMPESDCGELLINSDEAYDGGGYAWSYGGVQAPYYGAFGERYSVAGEVCGAVFDLTRILPSAGRTMDVYVWQDQGGLPGVVACVEYGVDPGTIAWFPSVSRHTISLSSVCCVESPWWVGYWGNWPGMLSDWYVGADQDNGSSGFPFTNVAPGIGYPTGWQNVSVTWGPTSALGIGALVRPCEPTPVGGSSWGAIKALYR
ncbi:MAG: hypothetical protein R3E97_24860 [Candidatus Eisenbacteria bacterium]